MRSATIGKWLSCSPWNWPLKKPSLRPAVCNYHTCTINWDESWIIAGLYNKALEHYHKSLASKLKQLGPKHPSMATSYNNMAFVYKTKKDLAKAKEYWDKAHTIRLKKLDPNDPDTKDTKAELDALKE